MSKGTVVVSLRSRGLSSFNAHIFFNGSKQLLALFTSLWDMSLSIITLVMQQTWATYLSLIVCICSFSFFASYEDGRLSEANFMWMIFNITIFLVLVLIIFWNMQRRDSALKELATVKRLVAGLHFGASSYVPVEHGETVLLLERELFKLLEDIHQYLYHKRPYATQFFSPFRGGDPPPSHLMFKISREFGIFLRKIQKDLRALYLTCQRLCKLGMSDIVTTMMFEQLSNLHRAVEQLSIIKEYRTPMALRALTYCYVTLILPLFLGPYFAYISNESDFFLAFMFYLIVQVTIVTLLNLSQFLEDPFDDTFLDTISLVEVFDQLYAILSDDAPNSEVRTAVVNSAVGAVSQQVPFTDGAAEETTSSQGGSGSQRTSSLQQPLTDYAGASASLADDTHKAKAPMPPMPPTFSYASAGGKTS